MPTSVHELFIDGVEEAIRNQLKAIRGGSDTAALFAGKVQSTRSATIYLPVDDASLETRSKHEPDASFQHKSAKYAGLIIKVAYLQEEKRLGQLAESYLLDSNASVQVVVGLNVEYGKEGSRKATLSVWRTHVVNNELRSVQVITNKVCPILRQCSFAFSF